MSVSTHFPPPSSRLDNISFILRHANVRYQRIADELRRSLRPSNHARRYAYGIGLKINITKAHSCPQRAISYHPLPILDHTTTPAEVHTSLSITEAACLSPRRISLVSPTHQEMPRNKSVPPIIIDAMGSARHQICLQTPISSSVIRLRSLPNTEDIPSDVIETPAVRFPSLDNAVLPSAPAIKPIALPLLEESDDSWMDNIVFSATDLSPQASPLGKRRIPYRFSGFSSSSSPDPQISEVVLTIILPAKRKYQEETNINDDNFQPAKQQFKSRWNNSGPNRKPTIRRIRRHSKVNSF